MLDGTVLLNETFYLKFHLEDYSYFKSGMVFALKCNDNADMQSALQNR